MKKYNRNKANELTKSTRSLQKAEKDLEASKTQAHNLQAEMKKYQDLEVEVRASKYHALKDKQALIDERAAKHENTYEKCCNDVIIAVTTEMKKIKNIIYQTGFEFGLEKAQIPINHKLQRLKVTCPQ